MKIKHWSLSSFFVFSTLSLWAQSNANSNIERVLQLAATQSSEAKVLDAKVNTKALEIATAKNNQLPDIKVSGTYMAITSPDVNLRIPLGSSNNEAGETTASGSSNIKTNQIMYGNLTGQIPIYMGGKVREGIKIAENSYELEQINADASKNNIAYQALNLYMALYKSQKAAELIEGNIALAENRVKDFQHMVDTGLIARNDLLKAQLHVNNYQVAKNEAIKNNNTIKYQLTQVLHVAPNDAIFEDINIDEVKKTIEGLNLEDAYNNRKEIKAFEKLEEIEQHQLKIAKAAYKPQIFGTVGYVAADIQNVVSVYNAANVGLCVSYDISSLYKNKKHVRVVESKMAETRANLENTKEQISIQTINAYEDYKLGLSKVALYKTAIAQADENYRIVKDKYDIGVADADDLLEADVQQLQSKINLANANADVIEKYYKYQLAIGAINNHNTNN